MCGCDVEHWGLWHPKSWQGRVGVLRARVTLGRGGCRSGGATRAGVFLDATAAAGGCCC
jgi:hypothetical protein